MIQVTPYNQLGCIACNTIASLFDLRCIQILAIVIPSTVHSKKYNHHEKKFTHYMLAKLTSDCFACNIAKLVVRGASGKM